MSPNRPGHRMHMSISYSSTGPSEDLNYHAESLISEHRFQLASQTALVAFLAYDAGVLSYIFLPYSVGDR